ncbi:MAG: hypothetical protein ACHQVK_01855 [Candidatus Paceibacterales bacterium]
MTEIVIDRKKYFLVPETEYRRLQRRAALKSKGDKTLTLTEARQYSRKLIKQWAKEK